jgi:hypothetical protein
MARWAPQRTDTLHALAEEVLQNYGHGRVVMAIDGPDAAITASFADDLAVEVRGLGNDVERASVAAGAELDAVRAAVVAPFRAAGGDGYLLVDGRGLLGALAGLWNFSVRLDSRDASSDRAEASAIVNVDDPEHPRRVFADSC